MTPIRLTQHRQDQRVAATSAHRSDPAPDVCPVGAIYSEEDVPDGTARSKYNADDPHTGHDHRYFIELSRTVFAD